MKRLANLMLLSVVGLFAGCGGGQGEAGEDEMLTTTEGLNMRQVSKFTLFCAVASPLLIALLISSSGCGGGSSQPNPPPPPPPPAAIISSLVPSSVTVGGGDFPLTVSGRNFVSASMISFNYNTLPTTFVSATELKATVPAAYIATPGPVPVAVVDPKAASTQANFDVNYPAPVITSLVPSHVPAGAAPVQLTVKGTGFFDSSTVKWNGVVRPAKLSSSQLLVALSANDMAAAGHAQVSVSNPTPGGGSSAATFTVDPFTSNPAPVVSSLSANRATAGWPGIPLLIKGSGFVAATTMQWNGSNRPSTPLSSSLLKTGIPVADLANSGNALVNIFTTGPGGGASSVKPFTIDAVATDAVGVVERSSVSTDLTEADSGGPTASMSANGRYIVFLSSFAAHPGGTSNLSHVFMRDTCVGAAAGCTPSLSLISQNDQSQPGNSESYDPFISATGRFVVFGSYSSNLVSGDTVRGGLFVRDTCVDASAGCTPTTKVVSSNGRGRQTWTTNGSPSVSEDGRFVAFTSGMSDYYYTKSSVINLRDTCTGAPSGCLPKTSRIDVGPGGVGANGFSFVPIISLSGRYVAFESFATNLVTPSPVSGGQYVFLRDTCLDTPGCTPSTTLISVDRAGSAVGAQLGAISSDGRSVVFDSQDGNIVTGDMNGFNDVFVRDTCNGAPVGCVPATTRVSLADDGSEGNGHCYGAAVRGSARFIAFNSDATNLITGDGNNNTDVFLRDTCVGAAAGCAQSTVRLSVALDGTQGNNASLVYGITSDAHYVVVVSQASNLAPGDVNAAPDVFLARTNVP